MEGTVTMRSARCPATDALQQSQVPLRACPRRRLLPLFWLMVVLNYIDRTNLAFAAIQLNDDLGFTPQAR